ncbi:MAG TPA: lasso peptide biosynthesis B2 protein [Terriglobales bacterium]|nr:lasso peptide biosynthesis B2 protein [Terriglobales bacterium]
MERRDFLRSAILLPVISVSLRLRGFVKTKNWLQKKFLLPGNHTEALENEERAASAARMVRAAGHLAGSGTSCLEESLALWWLLGEKGIAAELRIGVRKTQAKFEAHAWVEYGGKALNEPEARHRHFAAFSDALRNLPPENP